MANFSVRVRIPIHKVCLQYLLSFLENTIKLSKTIISWEDFPKIETSITEEIIYQPPIEEEEEIFDEWTEVFTITIRNIRYKIIWVGF